VSINNVITYRTRRTLYKIVLNIFLGSKFKNRWNCILQNEIKTRLAQLTLYSFIYIPISNVKYWIATFKISVWWYDNYCHVRLLTHELRKFTNNSEQISLFNRFHMPITSWDSQGKHICTKCMGNIETFCKMINRLSNVLENPVWFDMSPCVILIYVSHYYLRNFQRYLKYKI
jgi:hypothetical protein